MAPKIMLFFPQNYYRTVSEIITLFFQNIFSTSQIFINGFNASFHLDRKVKGSGNKLYVRVSMKASVSQIISNCRFFRITKFVK